MSIFRELKYPTLKVLGVSWNAVDQEALALLADNNVVLTVLDIGHCEPLADGFPFAVIEPLLGPHTEELGLADVASWEIVQGVAACCQTLVCRKPGTYKATVL